MSVQVFIPPFSFDNNREKSFVDIAPKSERSRNYFQQNTFLARAESRFEDMLNELQDLVGLSLRIK